MQQSIMATSLIIYLSFAVYGQVPTNKPTFDVASVKPNRTRIRGSVDFSKGGERFTATNMPLGALVVIAYNVTARQLSGPDEALSERYDIAAKADHPVRAAQMLLMLQGLLAERFKMVVHRETKIVPVYALTIGKGGPKLRQSDPPESDGVAPRTPAHAGGTESASGRLVFKNESMSDFAWALSRMAGIGDRVVVDGTGLKGSYDFELTVERDSGPPPGPDIREPAPRLDPLISSLQEQLGLKLESKKAPVEFIVIDRTERPSGN
jgi:uncharacterized protein (TIGR03435 family)